VPLTISVPIGPGQTLPVPLNFQTECFQDIFQVPGRVAVLPNCGIPITVSMQCWKPGYVFRAIITSVSVSNQGGFQFLHTLKNFIYLHTFNERIGEMNVSGITFAGGCDPANPRAGIESVLGYYDQLRTTRRYAPIQVVIGRLAFSAFLLGVRADIANADFGLGHFTFRLFYPPPSTANLGIFDPEDFDIGGCINQGQTFMA